MDTQTKIHYQLRFKKDIEGAFDRLYKRGQVFVSDTKEVYFSGDEIKKFYSAKRATKHVAHLTFDDFPFPESFDIFRMVEQTTFTKDDTPTSADDIARELEVQNYFPYKGEQ